MTANNCCNYSPTEYELTVGAGDGALGSISNGASGYVMVSNGTSANPSFQSLIQIVKVTLTSAQIKALLGTPITCIATGGANTIIIPIAAAAQFYYGGNNVFTNPSNIWLSYKEYNGMPIGRIIDSTMVTSSSNSFSAGLTNGLTQEYSPGQVDNVPVVLTIDGNSEITGNAANDNYVVVSILYSILKTS